ncbi:hypothetical protein OC709_02540 ['Planchonia careya' phytoplasma]|nr:hypothetical protein ['Planchonia careya' phytoplasma]MDO8030368.1 hypothetical protein ['Planchonia careya' phytoplasma]
MKERVRLRRALFPNYFEFNKPIIFCFGQPRPAIYNLAPLIRALHIPTLIRFCKGCFVNAIKLNFLADMIIFLGFAENLLPLHRTKVKKLKEIQGEKIILKKLKEILGMRTCF